LKTCGTVKLIVKFGSYRYHGVFHVLKENVPNILGITFFRDVRPNVDWSRSKVWIKDKQLPVQKYGIHKNNYNKPVNTNEIVLSNSFDGLPI
jgi:hypothetical protein